MKILLDSNITGLDANITFDCNDHSISTKKEHIDISVLGYNDLKFLFSLSNKQLQLPEKKYVNAFKTCGIDVLNSQIPWSKALPKHAYKKFMNVLVKDVCEIMNSGVFDYKCQVLDKQAIVFNLLKPAHVDVEILQSYIDVLRKKTGQVSKLELFKPSASGECKAIKYDRLGTITGRTRVVTGPDVLTLKKDHRRMFRSRYNEGTIRYVDYVSLEPRVALSVVDILPEDDVYAQIKNILKINLSRQNVKLMTLMTLYGATPLSISKKLKCNLSNTKQYQKKIKQLFKIEQIVKIILDQIQQNGYFTNKYGRPIRVDSKNVSILYNHYIQSTAVDVALLGFANICEYLVHNCNDVIPLFLIHDCLVLDCPKDVTIESLLTFGETIQGFDCKFKMEIKNE